MSRLDDALTEHERKLRLELSNAIKKKTELEGELARHHLLIVRTETDLNEVITELDRRGIDTERAKGTLITEEPDPHDDI